MAVFYKAQVLIQNGPKKALVDCYDLMYGMDRTS